MTKILQTLLLITVVIFLMILMKGFLIPFVYGLLIALIIYPVCKKLESRKVPRSLAITLSLLLVLVILSLVVVVFALQLKALNSELPELSNRLKVFFASAQAWINSNYGVTVSEQNSIITDSANSFFSNIGQLVSGTFSFAMDTVLYMVIVPLYTVLILYYRRVLVDFVASIIGSHYSQSLPEVLSETIHVYFNYVKGILKVYIIVGILNSIGLLILGVHYAILFGMVTAFMTIIPYVGIIISSILPMTMIWIQTNNIWYPVAVVGIFAFVQYLEANIIFPFVVGKQLGVNALVSIAAIFIGGVIWGVSGMVLFLPFIAMLKIISGHIDALKPLNKLLEIPKPS